MPTKVIRFKEGRYEGEVNAAGDPEGKSKAFCPNGLKSPSVRLFVVARYLR